MNKNTTFGIIGGDMRQIYLAEKIKNDGYDVKMYGFDNVTDTKIENVDLKNLVRESDYVILPASLTKDNIFINAPFSKEKMYIQEVIKILKGKIVFSGKIPSGVDSNGLRVRDYSSREEFAILNAIPTAEAALQIAISERDKTLYKSKCLVAGFGRIGKVLSRMLYAMGTNLTVSARRKSDLSWISSLNYSGIKTKEIKDSGKYDIIFNTIPDKIFDEQTLLSCTNKDTLIIDLASFPGGVDFEKAKEHKIKAIHALALPGKFFPQTSAELIKSTIYNIMKEENFYE